MREPSFSYVSHEDVVAGVHAIAEQLAASGWQPDFIVAIGRGGLVPGTYLSHRTGIPLLSVDYSSGVQPFGIALLGELARLASSGARLLLVDDINDTGGTIITLREAIASRSGSGNAPRVAVLIDNIRSAARVEYRARTIDRAVEKAWFVFPWEQMAPRDTLVTEALEVPERLA